MNSRKSLYDVNSFYNKKAVLKASFRGMRYQVEQKALEDDEKRLLVTLWPEPFCYEKTPDDKKTTKEFSYEEPGLDAAYEWICDQYEQRREEWEHAYENPYEGLF